MVSSGRSCESTQTAALVSRYAYTLDENANRLHQEEINGGASESTDYGYDDADRLTEVHYPDKAVTYTSDPVGNRLTETTQSTDGATQLSGKVLIYDERDRLVSVNDSAKPGSAVAYTCDANGNQASRTQSGVTTAFRYDARDHLVEVDQGGTLLETYLYDYEGMRVRKAGSSGIFRYVYDQGEREVIDAALRYLVQLDAQERIRELRGKAVWEGNLDELRQGRFVEG